MKKGTNNNWYFSKGVSNAKKIDDNWQMVLLKTNSERFSKISIKKVEDKIFIKGHYPVPDGRDDFKWESTVIKYI